MIFTNANVLEKGDLCKVQFRDGTSFESVNGKILSHCSGDSAFRGAWAEEPPTEPENLAGATEKKWEDLANKLENLLSDKLSVPREWREEFSPTLYVRGAPRCMVRWCRTRDIGTIPPEAMKEAMMAEFDERTGEVKALQLETPELLNWHVKF